MLSGFGWTGTSDPASGGRRRVYDTWMKPGTRGRLWACARRRAGMATYSSTPMTPASSAKMAVPDANTPEAMVSKVQGGNPTDPRPEGQSHQPNAGMSKFFFPPRRTQRRARRDNTSPENELFPMQYRVARRQSSTRHRRGAGHLLDRGSVCPCLRISHHSAGSAEGKGGGGGYQGGGNVKIYGVPPPPAPTR
jgi:hypothetical protein